MDWTIVTLKDLLKTPNSNSSCFNLFVSSFLRIIARNSQLEGTNTERSFE